MASSSRAAETTPLLSGEGDRAVDATPAAPAGSDPEQAIVTNDSEQDEPSTETGGGVRVVQLSPIHRVLFVMFCTCLALTCTSLVLLVTVLALNQYIDIQFGTRDWYFDRAVSTGHLFVGAIVAVLALLSILRLKTTGRPLPSLLVIMVLGCAAATLIASVSDQMGNKLDRTPFHCNPDLDDKNGYFRYPGSYAGCLAWTLKYSVVIWIYFACALANGLLCLVIFVTMFVKVYRERARQDGNSWSLNLPSRQISFDVTIRWGPPEPRES